MLIANIAYNMCYSKSCVSFFSAGSPKASIPFRLSKSAKSSQDLQNLPTEFFSCWICLLDPKKGVVDSIARDLCAFFHQESVLITESRVRAYYIKEELPE